MAVKKQSNGVKFYLVTYNALQTVGWVILTFNLLSYYFNFVDENTSLFQSVKTPLAIVQSAAVLEILHSATKIAPADVAILALQVLVRLLIVIAILPSIVTAQKSFGFFSMFTAWCGIETLRYAFYALHVINKAPYFLGWLQYSSFDVLYPVGFLGETLCIFSGVGKIWENEAWTRKLSEQFCITLHYSYIVYFLLIIIIPVFIHIYSHMLQQRQKLLEDTSRCSKKIQ